MSVPRWVVVLMAIGCSDPEPAPRVPRRRAGRGWATSLEQTVTGVAFRDDPARAEPGDQKAQRSPTPRSPGPPVTSGAQPTW